MDFLENIIPANVHSEDSLRKLSSEDFQKLLCGWFESSGLITETRSYLRTQLIKMLNTTKLGVQTNKSIEPAPPKVQMINMLFAEHLFRYKYLYTLSMFSNELTVLNIPPDFNFFFITEAEGEKRFKRNQILKIIHCLSITFDEADFEDLILEYEREEDKKSFLLCVLDYLVEKQKPPTAIEDVALISLLETLRQMFYEVSVPPETIRKIEKNIKEHFSLFEQKIKSGQTQREARKNNADDDRQQTKEDIGKVEEKNDSQGQMKLISIHNDKTKMIKRVYKYHISRMVKLQKQLEERLKEMEEGMKEKQQMPAPEKCTLKHCDDYCQETLNSLNSMRIENDKLNKVIKLRDSQIKKLTLKIAEMITDLEVVQKRVSHSNLKHFIKDEDEFSLSDNDESTRSKETEKPKDEDIERVFTDINKKLNDLEYENEAINSEYNLFKMATFV